MAIWISSSGLVMRSCLILAWLWLNLSEHKHFLWEIRPTFSSSFSQCRGTGISGRLLRTACDNIISLRCDALSALGVTLWIGSGRCYVPWYISLSSPFQTFVMLWRSKYLNQLMLFWFYFIGYLLVLHADCLRWWSILRIITANDSWSAMAAATSSFCALWINCLSII